MIRRHTPRQPRAAVTSSASSLRSVVALVRWSATPPGAACARRIAHERGAPVRPAPARHGGRPLRSRPPSRARPDQTGETSKYVMS